jgi:plasmid maintenance system antidote protein VapI
MTPKRVTELLHLYEIDGWEIPELARRYGVSVSTVSRIITGKTWKEITGGRNRSRAGNNTAYRVSHIEARLEQGCTSPTRIAKELGISRQAVAKLIRSHNLESKVA